MISKHHANWKIQAIRSPENPKPTDLHYSSVVSLAKQEMPRVRAILVNAIEEIRSIVKNSPEEIACTYTLDLFELID